MSDVSWVSDFSEVRPDDLAAERKEPDEVVAERKALGVVEQETASIQRIYQKPVAAAWAFADDAFPVRDRVCPP